MIDCSPAVKRTRIRSYMNSNSPSVPPYGRDSMRMDFIPSGPETRPSAGSFHFHPQPTPMIMPIKLMAMSRMIRTAIILPIVSLMLPSCRDDGKSAKSRAADKIEKEVARRVEVAKKELGTEERGRRLKTIRIVGFIFLSTGSAACLVWLSRPRLSDPYGRAAPSRIIPPPQWRDFRPPRKGRVLDLGSTPAAETTRRRPGTRYGRRNHEAPAGR